MSLTNDEKGMVEEALSVYLQLVSRQAPPEQVQQLAQVAQGIIAKLEVWGQVEEKKETSQMESATSGTKMSVSSARNSQRLVAPTK